MNMCHGSSKMWVHKRKMRGQGPAVSCCSYGNWDNRARLKSVVEERYNTPNQEAGRSSVTEAT